jgi:hypothetical protein
MRFAVAARRVVASVALVAGACFVSGTTDARADAAADKAATNRLLAAQSAALATFRAATVSAAKTLNADLVATEKALAGSKDGAAAAQALFDALVKTQVAETTALKTAAQAQADAAKDALATLAPATEGVYPAAFYPGQGTPTAAFEDAVDAFAAKTYVGLRKRAARTMQRIEHAGTHVALRLTPPRRPRRVWNSSFTDSLLVPHPTIDVVIAFSGADASGDGKMRAAGEAGFLPPGPVPFDNDVTVDAAFTGRGLTQEQKVTPADGRWSVDFGDADFVEGVWLVIASQNLGATDATIGVR